MPTSTEDLVELLSQYLDGTLPEAELADLEALLETDPEVADLLCELAIQHVQLHRLAAVETEAAATHAALGRWGRVQMRLIACVERLHGWREDMVTWLALAWQSLLPPAPNPLAAPERYGRVLPLHLALLRELRASSWCVSSVAIHVVALFLLLLWPASPRPVLHEPVIVDYEVIEPQEFVQEPRAEIVEREFEVNPEPEVSLASLVTITHGVEIADQDRTDDAADLETSPQEACDLATLADLSGTPSLLGLGTLGHRGTHGAFGFRRGAGRRYALAAGGGSWRTERAVVMALQWLAAHQEADGHWDAGKHGGDPEYNVAASALALLAFFGAGSSTEAGEYRPQVRKGLAWLRRQQRPNGCIGPHRYQAAIALMAAAEAYGMSNDAGLKLWVQRAVRWAARSQCLAGGWDYAPGGRKATRVDSSVTGWWVMAIKSAVTAGLDVPPEVVSRARSYCQRAISDPGADGLCSMSYTSTGRLGDVKRGGGSSRLAAVGLTCLEFLGVSRTDPQVVGCANRVIRDGLPAAEHADFYRWYYAALGLFQMGVRSRYWQAWNGSMKTALLALQVRTGSSRLHKGSWNPETDPHGQRWGRVGQTALGALTLEVYYRYRTIHTQRQRGRNMCLATTARTASVSVAGDSGPASRTCNKVFGKRIDLIAFCVLSAKNRCKELRNPLEWAAMRRRPAPVRDTADLSQPAHSQCLTQG